MKRKILNWSINIYDWDEDKQRLREKYLNLVDSTATSLSERASMWVDGQTELDKWDNISQTKNSLKRILKKD